jgi:hypothetical protein
MCNASYSYRCTIISLKNAETNFSMLEFYTLPLIIYDVSRVQNSILWVQNPVTLQLGVTALMLVLWRPNT